MAVNILITVQPTRIRSVWLGFGRLWTSVHTILWPKNHHPFIDGISLTKAIQLLAYPHGNQHILRSQRAWVGSLNLPSRKRWGSYVFPDIFAPTNSQQERIPETSPSFEWCWIFFWVILAYIFHVIYHIFYCIYIYIICIVCTTYIYMYIYMYIYISTHIYIYIHRIFVICYRLLPCYHCLFGKHIWFLHRPEVVLKGSEATSDVAPLSPL